MALVAKGLLVVLGVVRGEPSEQSKLLDALSCSKDVDTLALRQIVTQNAWWKDKLKCARGRVVSVETYVPEVKDAETTLYAASLPPVEKLGQITERFALWQEALAAGQRPLRLDSQLTCAWTALGTLLFSFPTQSLSPPRLSKTSSFEKLCNATLDSRCS